MFLAGTINLQGPEFEKKDIAFESNISGEFYLSTKKAAQLAVGDFNVWVQMDEDSVVTFKTDVMEHDGEIGEEIVMIMKSGDDKTEVSISMSPKQAFMLKQILEHYSTAYYAKKALMKEIKVDQLYRQRA